MDLGIVLILYPQRHHRADLCLTIAISGTEKPHSARPLVEQKTNRPKKKALKRLQDVSESFRLVFSSIRVFADSGTRHNTERDLFVTDYGCANRLWFTEQDYSRYPQTVAVPFHSLSRK